MIGHEVNDTQKVDCPYRKDVEVVIIAIWDTGAMTCNKEHDDDCEFKEKCQHTSEPFGRA